MKRIDMDARGTGPRGRSTKSAGAFGALVFAALLSIGCNRGQSAADAGADAGEVHTAAPTQGLNSAPPEVPPDPGKPLLGIKAFVATVYDEPRDTSKKLGYLRVGAKVVRSEEPVGKSGCPGGWYRIEPRGHICAGEEATTDLDDPILKAAERRPNLKTALPYRYGFVRAVLPLYLRVPTAKEQFASEFKLKEHLDWYKENEAQVNKVTLGAYDVPIDERGVPLPTKKLGELGLEKNSLEAGLGVLFGGQGEEDPPPFWLDGGKRAIPNISDFKVPEYAVFADRARRFTGLSLVGSFPTGEDSLNRRFAITTDLRLAPTTKLKPDSGSPYHGVELNDELTLPVAFMRAQGARSYKIVKGKVTPGGELEFRSVHALTGKMRTIEGVRYYRTKDRRWVHQLDVGLAVAPSTWPEDAEKGKKWIEISITNQTLVMWEGKRPIYATLVSTGQAGLDDPKKTTATVRGTFKIRNKHITATMDSNESSSVGGRANTTALVSSEPEGDRPAPRSGGKDSDKKAADKGGAKAASSKKTTNTKATNTKNTKTNTTKGSSKSAGSNKGSNKAKPASNTKPAGKPASSSDAAPVIPKKGDGVYGVTRRRGEGTYQLRDVPYIQYFESGYALHAAYWHDVFGTPRSHGCVNLSPVDAHRLFLWTDPPIPDGWHAINTGEEMGEGTTVIIHE
ncbi:MAG: L,D-transpeptidase family protein [Polyangiaceae bacterium]|nr:L,D-transpeptidase family protein [Polyangiaceae bacterium]